MIPEARPLKKCVEARNAMLNKIRITQKVYLTLAFTALGFAVVLGVNLKLGARNQILLDTVHTGFFRTFKASRDLEDILLRIQRGFQEAVETRSEEKLAETDALKSTFQATLQEAKKVRTRECANCHGSFAGTGGNLTIVGSARFTDQGEDFAKYYDLAREASLQTIRSGSEKATKASLESAQSQFKGLMERLEAATNAHTSEIDGAFETVVGNLRATKVTTSWTSVICLLLAAGLSFLIIRSLAKPLAKAVSVANRLAEGDLSMEIRSTSSDETGMLLSAMARMVESQRRMLMEIKQSSSQVASSAEEISASTVQIARGAESQSSATEETSSTMVEMASQIEHVSMSVQNLAANVDQTSTSIQEMSTSIGQVAMSGENLLASVEETGSTIEEMTASIRAMADKVKVVDAFSKDAATVADSGGAELSRVIQGIGASSRDIGKIIRIIEDIADQTNLLALNAAIEAARAGEAGKGFAVVAEEVKRLAERSMNSTREISAFVEAVQKDVSQAVELTGTVLNRIVGSVAKTSTLVGEAYLATQEQANGAAQILKATTTMQHVTREQATAAKEHAMGIREITKAAEEMSRMTQQVADATVEQKKGGHMVVQAMEDIARVACQNQAATEQLSKGAMGLAREAERLQQLAGQFTI
jgi:methyl-accepting chemotaxis protein